MAPRPPERERSYLDGCRRTTQLVRDSSGRQPTQLSPGAPMRMIGLAVLLLAICASPSPAQSGSYQAVAPATAALQLTASVPAVHAPLPAHADLLPARRFSSRAPGATLMIIGGAAIVAGILVGGSGSAILILGGVGVGAYGLYLYTR